MKNGVFLDVAPCGSCRNQRFGGSITSLIRVEIISELGTALVVTDLLVTTYVVSASPILSTLMMKEIFPSEKSVLTRSTRCHIPADAILHLVCCVR
jgi:hypothetical protein